MNTYIKYNDRGVALMNKIVHLTSWDAQTSLSIGHDSLLTLYILSYQLLSWIQYINRNLSPWQDDQVAYGSINISSWISGVSTGASGWYSWANHASIKRDASKKMAQGVENKSW